MTNSTIYRKAQTLPFVQFCKWYNSAVRKRKTRDSNNAGTLPSSAHECNEVGRTRVIIRRLSQVEEGAHLMYEDAD